MYGKYKPDIRSNPKRHYPVYRISGPTNHDILVIPSGQAGERSQVQEDWMDGKVPVITATISFGMGVDKATVRLGSSMTKKLREGESSPLRKVPRQLLILVNVINCFGSRLGDFAYFRKGSGVGSGLGRGSGKGS